MASGVNKVILVGNLGKDPEIRQTTGGSTVANFSIATSEQWTDKPSGEKKQKTEWHRIVFWGNQADIIGQYLTKGRQVYIEGKLQTRKWMDNNNIERYTTEVIGEKFVMLGGRQEQTSDNQQPPIRTPQNNVPMQNNNSYQHNEYSGLPGSPGFIDDDIPF